MEDISTKTFGILAVFAIIFAAAAVGVVKFLEAQVPSTPPKCGYCQYLQDGNCFDYDCCEDSECRETQMCVGHSCFDLDCPPDQIVKNHGCTRIILSNETGGGTENGTENQTELVLDCVDPEHCLGNETCLNNSCIPVECPEYKIALNHTCMDAECGSNDDCNATSRCVELKCYELKCRDCQYIANHTCISWECCEYFHCGESQICRENHTCADLDCPEGKNYFVGECIEYECTSDEDCDDNKAGTVDTCIEPGDPASRCEHTWSIYNFTGETTFTAITLHIGQTAYYHDKQSKITLLELRNTSGYYWPDRAKFDYTLWGQHVIGWILVPPEGTNTTVAAENYWENHTVGDDRMVIVMTSVSGSALTANFKVKYIKT